MDRNPIRCLCCGITFTHPSIYLHPSHRCVAPTPPERDNATTAPTATGAVVVPLFGRRK